MAHPLYRVPCPAGTLSIMPCLPAASTRSVLMQLRAQGVTHIASMLPEEQARALGMQDEAQICAKAGITFFSHPIDDFGLPEMASFAQFIQDIVELLRADAHVAVHCKAGIGRSGMVAAATLVAFGENAGTAQKIVSVARGVSIPDTVEQAIFIKTYADNPAL